MRSEPTERSRHSAAALIRSREKMAEQLAEALAAALGGSFSKGVLYPMDIIKNNLQAVKAVRPLFASDTPRALAEARWMHVLREARRS